jgi:hypothetical protein
MKEEKNDQKKQLRIVLRFTSSGKVYSLMPLHTWTVKKLKSFINYTFKDDVKNNQVNLYYGAKLLNNDALPLTVIFQNNKEELNQIIVNLKSRDKDREKEEQSENRKNSYEITINNSEAARKEIVSEMLFILFS